MAHQNQQNTGNKPDINQASKDELMRAPGIGEELADRIIENRPYHSAKDVDQLFEVGDTRVDQIKSALKIPQA